MQGLFGQGLALHSGGIGLSSTWYIERAVNRQKTCLKLSFQQAPGDTWLRLETSIPCGEGCGAGRNPGIWAHLTVWTHLNTENHLALDVKGAELEETTGERFVVRLEKGLPVVCTFICIEFFATSFISGSGAEHPLLWTLATHG